MEACININSAEFRALKERSGLSDFALKVAIGAYLDAHEGQWPKLDEIPGANSQNNLEESLNLDRNSSTKINNILEATGTLSIDEATIKINSLHRDLNTSILPLNEEAIVTIEKRPSPFELRKGEKRNLDEVNSRVFIGLALKKLLKGFGILTIFKSTSDLKKEGILDKVPEGVHVAAFVLDGNIIVNSDIASVDAPVHELLHVLLGSLKFTNPDAYMLLVSLATNLSCFEERAALYPHRSQSDVLEEVFVSEYAKFLSGINNGFENLDPEAVYQINYEVSRNLDTILNGDNSVRVIPQAMRFGSTLRTLGKMVNSKDMLPLYQGYADSAYISRIIGNVKEDLFRNNSLEEICD